MTTNLSETFEKYYIRFWEEVVGPFEQQCQKRNFIHLQDCIRLLPPPAFFPMAMPKIKILCKKENIKETFLSWAGPLLTDEEKEYLDTAETGVLMARLLVWMKAFRVLLVDYE